MNTFKFKLLAFILICSLVDKSQCVSSFTYSINQFGNVSFTNLSSAPSATMLSYWSFGDNQFSTQLNPSHTYFNNSTFVVSLSISDSASCFNTSSQTITISNATCVINPGFSFNTLNSGQANFTNTTYGTSPTTSYTLDFGDNTNLNYVNNSFNTTSHTYTSNGIYAAILTAQDGASCINTYSANLNINNSQCTLTAGYTASVSTNGVVTFTNTSTPTSNFIQYYWDFGDAQSSTLASPTHTYYNNSAFVVSLFISDSLANCTDIFTQTLTVSTATCFLMPSFIATTSNSGIYSFTNTSTGTTATTSYTLNFGDGNVSIFSNNSFNAAVHTYTANGAFIIILNTSDGSTCANSYSTQIMVNNVFCNLQANFIVTAGSNGSASFANTSTGTSTNTINYYWVFGNNNQSFAQTPPTQTYPANGVYFITLNMSDSTGTFLSNCSSSITQTISITNLSCTAISAFTLQKDSTMLPAIVWDAFPTYPPNVTGVTWNWGDNTSSTAMYPSHTYSAAGFYNICLTVSVSCGTITTTCSNSNIYKTNANASQMATVNVRSTTTNVKENTILNNVHIFPNPVKDILYIENEFTGFTISITNIFGKMIYTVICNDKKEMINLEDCATGIYIITLQTGADTKNFKLIKN